MKRKKPKAKTPTIIDVDFKRFDIVLQRAETNSLTDDDYQLIHEVFDSYINLTGLVGNKAITIARLRKLLFGFTSEKTEKVIGKKPSDATENRETTADDSADSTETVDKKKTPKPGHGRNPADAYTGGDHEYCSHQKLEPGDVCPQCRTGTLYELKTPGVIVRIVGQPPLKSTVYKLQKLRCHACGKVFTADPPAGIGEKKYNAMAVSTIAVLKYGSGLPFNRLAGLQRNLGIPLAASTQWDVVAGMYDPLFPIYEELICQAAAGDCLHNDDTTIKILQRTKAVQALKDPDYSIEDNLDSFKDLKDQRTGTFTTGIVSVREGVRVALFFSGPQHAGENLDDVLQHRSARLSAPIQMCDALTRNVPKNFATILANCMSHARRRFVDVHDQFPSECEHLLNSLKTVYHTDSICRKRKFGDERRLMYHRAKSKPVMDELKKWLQRQFDEKLVEPNSALGDAIQYMLNHWEKLTLFLRVAGAPLDNNICERALKKAILHRKNSLFYKTQHGANVGDLYMSLIYTCELCQANPLEYLTQLQNNQEDLTKNPENWMPWNYQNQQTPKSKQLTPT